MYQMYFKSSIIRVKIIIVIVFLYTALSYCMYSSTSLEVSNEPCNNIIRLFKQNFQTLKESKKTFILDEQFKLELILDSKCILQKVEITRRIDANIKYNIKNQKYSEYDRLIESLSGVISLGKLIAQDEIGVVTNGKSWRTIVYEKAFVIKRNKTDLRTLENNQLESITIYFPITRETTVDAIIHKKVNKEYELAKVRIGSCWYFLKEEPENIELNKVMVLKIAGPID